MKVKCNTKCPYPRSWQAQAQAAVRARARKHINKNSRANAHAHNGKQSYLPEHSRSLPSVCPCSSGMPIMEPCKRRSTSWMNNCTYLFARNFRPSMSFDSSSCCGSRISQNKNHPRSWKLMSRRLTHLERSFMLYVHTHTHAHTSTLTRTQAQARPRANLFHTSKLQLSATAEALQLL